MDDLISRADAYEVFADYFDLIGFSRRYAKSLINKVPSTQYTSKIIDAYTRGYKDGADAVKAMPFTQSKIVRCKECKWYNADEYSGIYRCYRGLTDVIADDFCSCGERQTERSE